MESAERVIVSLDTTSKAIAKELVSRTEKSVGIYSLGLPLLLKEGVEILEPIRKDVMLDLKLGDTEKTIDFLLEEVLAPYQDKVRFLTLSPFIGKTALCRAQKVVGGKTDLVMATPGLVLNQTDAEFIHCSDDQFLKSTAEIVRQALMNKISYVLCSPDEIGFLKAVFGDKISIIADGVENLGKPSDVDEATPYGATNAGADYVLSSRLIGRHGQPNDIAIIYGDYAELGFKARNK